MNVGGEVGAGSIFSFDLIGFMFLIPVRSVCLFVMKAPTHLSESSLICDAQAGINVLVDNGTTNASLQSLQEITIPRLLCKKDSKEEQ